MLNIQRTRRYFREIYVFLQYFIKNSISQNSGFKIFLEEAIQREGKTILSTIPASDSELVRNSISSELTPIIDRLFGELYDIDEEVNKNSYRRMFYWEQRN